MPATALKCKECGQEAPLDARFCCDLCFGPLEVAYDHSGLDDAAGLRRKIQAGPNSIWRYSDFLPFERRPRVALEASWVHISNARLFNSQQNPGIDMMGLRANLKL